MKKPIPLPDNPSKLIRLAIHDLTLCEKSSKYRIHMGTWHSIGSGGVCRVCLAGAVMAKSLKIPIEKTIGAFELDERDTKLKIIALDDLRTGDVCCVNWWREVPINLPEDREIVEYSEDPKLFKEQMLQLASDFEAMEL